jgi:TRAP-type C4-dicarboxylate transport system permease small subunit
MSWKKLGQAVNTGITQITRGSGWISGVVIGILMCMVFADVFGRYVLNRPIKGNQDIVVMLLVVAIFLAVGYTQLKKGHIGVELLYARLSGRTQVILDIFNYLLGVIIYGLMAWQLIQRAWNIWTSTKPPPTTFVLPIPHAPFILTAGIGALVLCLVLIVGIFHSFVRMKGD